MEFDWQPFLKQWSQEALSAAEYTDDLPTEAIEAQWLGKAGATESQIAEAEKRLGITFPPSYREFLAVTNGWHQLASNGGLLRDKHRQLMADCGGRVVSCTKPALDRLLCHALRQCSSAYGP